MSEEEGNSVTLRAHRFVLNEAHAVIEKEAQVSPGHAKFQDIYPSTEGEDPVPDGAMGETLSALFPWAEPWASQWCPAAHQAWAIDLLEKAAHAHPKVLI